MQGCWLVCLYQKLKSIHRRVVICRDVVSGSISETIVHTQYIGGVVICRDVVSDSILETIVHIQYTGGMVICSDVG